MKGAGVQESASMFTRCYASEADGVAYGVTMGTLPRRLHSVACRTVTSMAFSMDWRVEIWQSRQLNGIVSTKANNVPHYAEPKLRYYDTMRRQHYYLTVLRLL